VLELDSGGVAVDSTNGAGVGDSIGDGIET
jgi:hypothetical protein